MRVALSGHGLVCSLGLSVADAWPRILRGERGIGPISLFETTGQRTHLAAQLPSEFASEQSSVESSPRAAPWSRSDRMALRAAREALAEAGLDPRTTRMGLVVGGTTGGMFETEALLAAMHADPALRVPNPAMLAHPLSATADRLAEVLGRFVRTRTVCSACSSGANALLLGALWIELGLVEVVLAGGTDGLCRLTYTGFNALSAMDEAPARPFDVTRRGLTMGEGAGFVVLESTDHARRRGRVVEVELVGAGITSDAHHITNPEETGGSAARALGSALASADLSAADIDYVNAHGTGTPLNDPMEARALKKALGVDIGRVWVSSTKGLIGHTLGAAGAIEAVLTALAVREGRLPPSGGLRTPDPACAPLRCVPEGGVKGPVRAALSSSFGFGGVNTVLALRHATLETPTARERPSRGPVFVTGIGSAGIAGAFAGADNVSLLSQEPRSGDRGGPRPSATPLVGTADPTSGLDPARARRLDRTARLATVAALQTGTGPDDGVVLGSSFGDIDGSAAFLARLFERGPRLASPADFPNLVPSSSSGHVSIYLGLHGPAMVVADLSTSGEAALATAYELIAGGQCRALVAGSAEGPSELAATCLAPVFRNAVGTPRRASEHDDTTASARSSGAAVLRLSAEPPLQGPRVELVSLWPGASLSEVIATLPPPPPGRSAVVVVGEQDEAWVDALGSSPWSTVPLHDVVGRTGRHEGLGGFTAAAAAGLLWSGQADVALILGRGPGRAYALLLARQLD